MEPLFDGIGPKVLDTFLVYNPEFLYCVLAFGVKT